MHIDPAHQNIKSCWTVSNSLIERTAIVSAYGASLPRIKIYSSIYSILDSWFIPVNDFIFSVVLFIIRTQNSSVFFRICIFYADSFLVFNDSHYKANKAVMINWKYFFRFFKGLFIKTPPVLHYIYWLQTACPPLRLRTSYGYGIRY